MALQHSPWKLLGVLLGWTLIGAIWSASLLTPPETGLDIPQQDKWGHLIAYGGLMGWFAMLYRSDRVCVLYFVGFALMGGLLELIQGTLPHRQASLADLAANVTGLSLGWWMARLIWSRKLPPPAPGSELPPA